MKRILIIVLVLLMLAGCSGNGSDSGSSAPVEEEIIYTMDDGIIPYLTSHTVNLEYDNFIKEDQEWDYTVEQLYDLEPLKKEGRYYEAIRNTFTDEQLEGELYFVNEIYRVDGEWGISRYYYDQTDTENNHACIFWVMKDDPEKKILTVYEYRGYDEADYGQEETVYGDMDFYRYGGDIDGMRYVIDYSSMDEDDWPVEVTELYTRMDSVTSKPYTFKGYMTVYEPVEGIEKYTTINVKESGLRLRGSPEIRDDNKIGVLKPEGTSFYFEFFLYEKTENDGYTWYRIGKKRWVASDGTWIDEYVPEKE